MTAESPEIIEQIPADFLSDPYDLFARLRSGPRACQVVMPHGAKVWMVTRYEDVRTLLSDPRISKDGRRMDEMYVRHSGGDAGDSEPGATGFDEVLSSHMLNADPPLHTRLRAPLSKAFTPSAIRRLAPRIEQVADELLDAMDGHTAVDLAHAFSAPLALVMICEIFGIPEADRHDIERWSTSLIGSGHPADEVAEAGRRFTEYTNAAIDARRAHPGDDLISDLLRVSEDDPARLSHDELVANIFVVLAAGLDTPMRQLSVAVYTLLTHPDVLATLRDDLSLMPAAVDELMRFDGTVATASFRFAEADIRLGEVTIPAGEMVLLSLASANRDGAHFENPDQLDLHRVQVGNLSLGHGYHYCIGAHLAKQELEIGLARLITRYPDLRLAVEPHQLRWERGNLLRSLIELPVLLTTADQSSEPPGRGGTERP